MDVEVAGPGIALVTAGGLCLKQGACLDRGDLTGEAVLFSSLQYSA